MLRLSTLLVSNNYIFRVGSIGESLPNLTSLVLTNNRIASLSEIDHLATLEKLELLSLMDNPVTEHPHYRLYVIHRLPSLKSLDFRKVTKSERDEAARLFSSAEGRSVASAVAAESQQEGIHTSADTKTSGSELRAEQREQIRQAIEAAATQEEVDRIEHQLRVSESSVYIVPVLCNHIICCDIYMYVCVDGNFCLCRSKGRWHDIQWP